MLTYLILGKTAGWLCYKLRQLNIYLFQMYPKAMLDCCSSPLHDLRSGKLVPVDALIHLVLCGFYYISLYIPITFFLISSFVMLQLYFLFYTVTMIGKKIVNLFTVCLKLQFHVFIHLFLCIFCNRPVSKCVL